VNQLAVTSRRKLVAVVFADMVGYTAIMRKDEASAVSKIGTFESSVKRFAAEYKGTIEHFYGDGCLLTFDSPVEAVAFSGQIQNHFIDNQLDVRIGIHLGDVLYKSDNVYGDTINLTSRIQSKGVAGSVLLSRSVYEQVRNHASFQSVGLGYFSFKNVDDPIEIFALKSGKLKVPTRSEISSRRRFLWPVSRQWRMLILIIVAIPAAYFLYKFPGPAKTTAPQSDEFLRVAVFPFSVSGTIENEYLSTGLMDLLSTRLDGIGPLRAVSPRAIMGLLQQKGKIQPDITSARSVLPQLAAHNFILGSLVESGGKLSISAGLFDASGSTPIVEANVEGTGEDVFALVDRLTSQLAAEMHGNPGERTTQLAALTTESLPALKAYLKGEELFRRGQFTGAHDAFQNATRLDSTFALAHYKLSIAKEWGGRDGATESAETALRFASRLSERDRHLVEGMVAWRRGDGVRAEEVFKNVIGTWPDDLEAWGMLAEIYNHFLPLRGGSISESREAFETILKYEPDQLAALWHLIRIEVMEDNLTHAEKLLEKIRELSPEGDRTLELEAMVSAAEDSEAYPKLVDAFMNSQDITRFMGVWNVSVFAEDLNKARMLLPALQESTRSSEVRATGFLIEAVFAYAQGQFEASEAAMDELEGIDPGLALSHSAFIALLPFSTYDTGQLQTLLADLIAWQPVNGCLSQNPVANYEPNTCFRPLVKTYLIGLLQARLGDLDQAKQQLARVQTSPETDLVSRHYLEYAAALSAEIHLSVGDSTAALKALEDTPGHLFYVEAMRSIFYSHSRNRYLRASLLEEMGRYAEAIKWYNSFDEMSLYDLIFQGPAQFRCGVLAEKLNQPTQASSYYQEALRYLDGGEGKFGQWADEANRALERLQSNQ
jgi:class 3 adenylate cyclase/tetratricopeptide (TPR) repeat protein